MDDAIEELDLTSEFEEALFSGKTYAEVSSREAGAIADAHEKISSLTACTLLTEAYIAATNIRNVIGDGDAYAADQATTIRTNILVLLQELAQQPIRFILDVYRAQYPDDTEFRTAVGELCESIRAALEQGDA